MLDETQLRFIIFFGVLILMMAVEALFPKRNRVLSRSTRWVSNLLLLIINALVLRLMGPITALVAAEYALNNDWGIFAWLSFGLPFYAEVAIAILLLDLAIYAQHIAFHRVNFLWRFHKVHHADRDIDVTTGIRFHPVEIVLSMLYKCVVILLLGPAMIAVLLFEILLSAASMFNHANVRLPKIIDCVLRTLIVTPDVHRVHHSTIVSETNSNYGFFLLAWDRLFKTYTAQPAMGHKKMLIGLAEYQTYKPSSLVWNIFLPFRKK